MSQQNLCVGGLADGYGDAAISQTIPNQSLVAHCQTLRYLDLTCWTGERALLQTSVCEFSKWLDLYLISEYFNFGLVIHVCSLRTNKTNNNHFVVFAK